VILPACSNAQSPPGRAHNARTYTIRRGQVETSTDGRANRCQLADAVRHRGGTGGKAAEALGEAVLKDYRVIREGSWWEKRRRLWTRKHLVESGRSVRDRRPSRAFPEPRILD